MGRLADCGPSGEPFATWQAGETAQLNQYWHTSATVDGAVIAAAVQKMESGAIAVLPIRQIYASDAAV